VRWRGSWSYRKQTQPHGSALRPPADPFWTRPLPVPHSEISIPDIAHHPLGSMFLMPLSRILTNESLLYPSPGYAVITFRSLARNDISFGIKPDAVRGPSDHCS
jgi:hypothetical protein